jgi:hypothetical protein
MFLVDICAEGAHLIFMAIGDVPDLLHHLNCLPNRHVPGVSSLTNKGHIRSNKCVAEPSSFNPVREFFISTFFRSLCRATGPLDLNDKMLDQR